ncbi:MAG: phosphotransferase, partial [Mycobacteriaceae bacterium]|nr:phosphotransferase [Mycobacteriaceae bacterium]
MSGAPDLSEALRAWIEAEVGDPSVIVRGLHRTSAGYSRENWVFEARWDANPRRQEQRLILRRDPPGSVLDTDRRVETAVLRAVDRTAIPSPSLRWADPDGERLDRPAIVMDLVDGYCDGFALAGDAPVEQRLQLAHRLYDYLADIHQL